LTYKMRRMSKKGMLKRMEMMKMILATEKILILLRVKVCHQSESQWLKYTGCT
jgi:hypothetical protein